MRRVAPRVAPKLLVLIPIKPGGVSTKSTYVGAGAGACVRIDWIGLKAELESLDTFEGPGERIFKESRQVRSSGHHHGGLL